MFQMDLFPRKLKKMSTTEFELTPVALTTQAHQHLLKRIIFNFINYVKVKWSFVEIREDRG